MTLFFTGVRAAHQGPAGTVPSLGPETGDCMWLHGMPIPYLCVAGHWGVIVAADRSGRASAGRWRPEKSFFPVFYSYVCFVT